jgi:hypothetical protein
MTVTAKRLVPGSVLTTTQVKLYEATGESAIIEQATFTNLTGGNAIVSAWLVPSGGTLTPATQIQVPVNAGVSVRSDVLAGHVIEDGGALWMSADFGVSAMVTGAGVT